ncbi:MAG: ribbon-helix-helix protein, CopG family [Acidobacteriia bacterium]|nr:ribbon-helix-helix protein, CopG family [Terriglobia bacterium]MYG05008.1 ribbon-helix-helix protein, CopG family [Terriglobia bacterium]MYK11234.1 ribbon-helix-helix protein, CopG family [Terriglobia bacterium]
MKAIQVTFDESLLERLDSHPAVKQRGRSAILRDAAIDYLRKQERAEIDRLYGEGYGETNSVESELLGWDEEGVWPRS